MASRRWPSAGERDLLLDLLVSGRRLPQAFNQRLVNRMRAASAAADGLTPARAATAVGASRDADVRRYLQEDDE